MRKKVNNKSPEIFAARDQVIGLNSIEKQTNMESSEESSSSETGSFAFANASYYDEDVEVDSKNDVETPALGDGHSNLLHAPISGDISNRMSNEERSLRQVKNCTGFGALDLKPIVRPSEQGCGSGVGDRKKLEPLRPRTKRGARLVRPPSRMGRDAIGKPGYSDNWIYNEPHATSEEPQLVDLFNYVHVYKPYKVRCSIKLYGPDVSFIPAIDAVYTPVEVARPDGRDPKLGVDVLNEASVKQSDPTVLRMKHDAVSTSLPKRLISKMVPPGIDPGPHIADWIVQMGSVASLRPPTTLQALNAPMPPLENLLAPWHGPMGRLLAEMGSAVDPDLDCDLARYIDVVCCLFGIPVYEDRTRSLHVLFSMYLACRDTVAK